MNIKKIEPKKLRQKRNKEIQIGIKIANGKLSKKEQLKIQLEVVTGNMLGDGCLVTDAIKSEPKGYSMQLTSKDREYINHLYNVYKPWTTAKIYDKKKGKKNKAGEDAIPNWAFITTVQKELVPFKTWRDTFTKPTRKILPPDIENLMTPRVIAYWFMDDGGSKKSNPRACVFNTDSFSGNETEMLLSILNEKYKLKAYSKFNKGKKIITIVTESYDHFNKLF